MLVLQNATGNVLSMGTEYLQILSYGALPTMAGAALPMLIRNDNQPRIATRLVCIGAFLNIVLDWLFVVLLDMGIQGAAVATALAQSVVMVLGVWYFFSDRATDRLTLSTLNLSPKVSLQVLGTGAASLVMFLYFSFVLIIHNILFLKYGGVLAVAAFTVVGYVQVFYFMLTEGVANGIQPLISFNKGAGNNRNIRETLFIALKVVIATGIVALFLVNVFPDQVAGIFINDDPALLDMIRTGYQLHLFALFLDGFIMISATYFQSMAMARLATGISLANMLVQLPLLYFLPPWLGIAGVWLAMPVSNVVLSLIVVFFVIRDVRNRKDALIEAVSDDDINRVA